MFSQLVAVLNQKWLWLSDRWWPRIVCFPKLCESLFLTPRKHVEHVPFSEVGICFNENGFRTSNLTQRPGKQKSKHAQLRGEEATRRNGMYLRPRLHMSKVRKRKLRCSHFHHLNQRRGEKPDWAMHHLMQHQAWEWKLQRLSHVKGFKQPTQISTTLTTGLCGMVAFQVQQGAWSWTWLIWSQEMMKFRKLGPLHFMPQSNKICGVMSKSLVANMMCVPVCMAPAPNNPMSNLRVCSCQPCTILLQQAAWWQWACYELSSHFFMLGSIQWPMLGGVQFHILVLQYVQNGYPNPDPVYWFHVLPLSGLPCWKNAMVMQLCTQMSNDN